MPHFQTAFLNTYMKQQFKYEKGSRKADGTVLKEGKAIAVVELKTLHTVLGAVSHPFHNP